MLVFDSTVCLVRDGIPGELWTEPTPWDGVSENSSPGALVRERIAQKRFGRSEGDVYTAFNMWSVSLRQRGGWVHPGGQDGALYRRTMGAVKRHMDTGGCPGLSCFPSPWGLPA